MAGKSNTQLARNANAPSEVSATVHGKRQRQKMVGEWGLVLDMLTGKKPRLTKDGRNITQVWADMVLADPPGEFARVAQYLLPPETAPDAGAAGGTVANIQSLYLLALTGANQKPVNQIEGEAQGANGVQPDLSDW